MRFKHFLCPLIILTALPCQVFAGGIPVYDAARFAERLRQFTQKTLDYERQLEKLAEAREILAKGRETFAEMRTLTTEITRSAEVVTSVQESPVFQTQPGTANARPAEASSAATVLFGKPRPGLERRIIRTALAFKDRPGVAKIGLTPFEWRALFQSLIKQESAFNPTARSPVGAYGLTQLMPGTAKDMGVNPHDIDDNLRGGAKYITIQLNTFGRIDHALAAYNAGPGNVRKYGGIPPFKETQSYVNRINTFWRDYIARHGSGAAPDTTGLGEAGDLANGERGATAEAVTVYADGLREEADQARARIQEIVNRIDSAKSEKTARDLNTALKAEIAKLLGILSRLRAAVAELEANTAILLAQNGRSARSYLDWRYQP